MKLTNTLYNLSILVIFSTFAIAKAEVPKGKKYFHIGSNASIDRDFEKAEKNFKKGCFFYSVC